MSATPGAWHDAQSQEKRYPGTDRHVVQRAQYSKNKNSCFPAGCADAAEEDGRCGSNVYEVNTWLWQFGRGKPRFGCLTIEETSDRQDSASKALDKRRKETRDGRKGDDAWLENEV